ncbi:hypothetical protein PRK78_005797 [Emydomyces testavorans]|uniref:Carrier domain-containing protein n=1 Tax=Emydomyces testavorans TaxID=2070801 RepID=A0AAF0IL13_9EURO|nr:hypothetical protein PRK78_005797 [Emydomyces testavorans]
MDNDFEISLFPVLNDGGNGGRTLGSVSARIEQSNGASCSPTDQPSLEHIVKAAWAILLAKYLDKPSVCFGVIPEPKTDCTVEQWHISSDIIANIGNVGKRIGAERRLLGETGLNARFNTCICFEAQVYQRTLGLFGQLSMSDRFYDLVDYEITIIVGKNDGDIDILLCYWTSTLCEEQAWNLAMSLCHIVRSFHLNHQLNYGELNLLGHENLKQLASWNNLAPTKRVESCVHDIIQQHCQIQPEAEAICAWDGKLTYAQLNWLSSCLQVRLQDLGVGPEMVVPVCFEKSKWTLVAILGILKAGGAFVLLEPSYPLKRLSDMCDDVEAKVVVSSVLQAELSSNLAHEIIVLPDSIMNTNGALARNSMVSPSNAAYVAYTSGSTGKPKGVVIEHSTWCSNVIQTSKFQDLSHTSRVLQFASYAFDVSIHEMLATLMVGGCVCVPSMEQRVNNLSEAITELQVNWAELTPSVIRLLKPEETPTLRTLTLGGESMSQKDITTWTEKVHLMSAYGPAECSVNTTVNTKISHTSNPSNIGRPFAGTCWIVDPVNHHQLMPIGAVGELLVGGPIVGRGYKNRPGQTRAAFISRPAWASLFNIGENERFYKTGDLVRHNVDGTIRYIGRKDTQVKLNGQRIELGDVEFHARRFLDGASAIADVVLPMQRKTKPMLALFVGSADISSARRSVDKLFQEPSERSRRIFAKVISGLKGVLPSHMIPSLCIPLPYLPLTKTEKVDRKRLRQAAAEITDLELRKYRSDVPITTKASPSSHSEQILQRLFGDILGISDENIGVDDGFFHLGGDSVGAIALVARSREEGIHFSAMDVFMHPTVSKLALCARTAPDSAQPKPFLTDSQVKNNIDLAVEQCQISRSEIEDILPCTPLQEGLMVLTIKKLASLIGQYVFQLPKSVDPERFKLAWDRTIESSPILRTRIILGDAGRALQVIIKKEIDWEFSGELNSYLTSSREPSMTFGAPLMRLAIVDEHCGKGFRLFVLTMHHALFDAWSYTRLLEEVEANYNGQHTSPTSFIPFLEYVSRLDISMAERFWTSEFAGLAAPIFPAPPSAFYEPQSFAYLTRGIAYSNHPRDGHTLSTVIRLAWAVVVSTVTGSEDVIFGVTVTGRSAPVAGVERMMGPTIATLPFRVKLDRNATIDQSLRCVQDQATALIPFEQTGIQNIRQFSVEASAACDFQSLLIVQAPAQSSSSKLFAESLKTSEQDLRYCSHCLTLVFEPESESISVKALYDVSTLSQSDVSRLLNQFGSVLQTIISEPNAKLSSTRSFRVGLDERVANWNGKANETANEKTNGNAIGVGGENGVKHGKVGEAGSNGKTSQKRLPSTNEERKLQEIVANVLGLEIEEVGVEDNLFALGIDSITAMRVVSQCRKVHLSLSASDVFHGKSIALLSLKFKPTTIKTPPVVINGVTDPVEAAGPYPDRHSTSSSFSPISMSNDELRQLKYEAVRLLGISSIYDIEDIYSSSPMHHGLLMGQTTGATDHQFRMILEVKADSGAVDPYRLQAAWKKLIDRHPLLRTILVKHPDQKDRVQHVVLRSVETQPVLLCSDEDAIQKLTEYQPLELRYGDFPQRFTICQTTSGKVFAKYVGGQAVIDATSMSIILRELPQAYDGTLPLKQPPPYSSLISYLSHLSHPEILEYWEEYLLDAQPCILRQSSLEKLGQNCPRKLEAVYGTLAEPRSLRTCCESNGFTISNIFQVAWALVLRSRTAWEDICFGSLASGRDAPIPEIENIVGPFFNVLPCRMRLAGSQSLFSVLTRNQVAFAGNLAHQHCSLLDMLDTLPVGSRPLFNSCLSIIPHSKVGKGEETIRLEMIEAHDPTEVFSIHSSFPKETKKMQLTGFDLQYDIVITINLAPDRISARLTYWSPTFSEPFAASLLEAYALAVNHILLKSDDAVSAVNIGP